MTKIIYHFIVAIMLSVVLTSCFEDPKPPDPITITYTNPLSMKHDDIQSLTAFHHGRKCFKNSSSQKETHNFYFDSEDDKLMLDIMYSLPAQETKLLHVSRENSADNSKVVIALENLTDESIKRWAVVCTTKSCLVNDVETNTSKIPSNMSVRGNYIIQPIPVTEYVIDIQFEVSNTVQGGTFVSCQ